jgi:hypothetical protein
MQQVNRSPVVRTLEDEDGSRREIHADGSQTVYPDPSYYTSMRQLRTVPAKTAEHPSIQAERDRVTEHAVSVAELCNQAGQPLLVGDFIRRELTIEGVKRELARASWSKAFKAAGIPTISGGA